jgi:hypothetical protein
LARLVDRSIRMPVNDRRHTTLLASILVAGLVASSCTRSASAPGVARVLVTCGTTEACAPIARVTVAVTRGDGPDFPPIVEDLPRSGDQWSGRIGDIPAGPGRHFAVEALDKDGKRLFSGEGRSDIAPGAAAVISVFLNGTESSGPVMSFPVIDSLTMSRNQVAPARPVQVSVTAHDAAGGTEPLSYWWRASCGSYDDPARAAATWTSPGVEGTCQLSISVANPRGATVTASLSIVVTTQVGDATIIATINSSPVISSLSGRVTLGPVLEGDLTAVAADPDGDPLTFAWDSDCRGLTFDFHIPYGNATPHLAMAGPTDACKVTVTVTDGPARGGRTTASIVLPPNVSLASRCSGVTCQTGQTCEPADGLCKAPSNPCAGVTCQTGQACDPADGTCKSNGDPCTGVTCTPSDLCHVAGTCNPSTGLCGTGAAKVCASGQTCDLADGVCKGGASTASLPRPQVARHLEMPNFQGVAVATDGSAYVTGTLALPTRTFDAFALTSAGAGDAMVARYGTDGIATWARNFGDSADQQPTAIAVTADGTVATIGQFNGTLTGSVANSRNTPIDYLLGLRAADGSVKFARGIDNGVSGVLIAVAANPALNLIAVCGYADKAATDLVPGATYGGGRQDAVIGLFDSAGTLLWSRQIGGANEEECDALAIDDAGDVYAAGRYDGALSITGSPLPNPASSFRRWIWLARFAGANGAPVTQTSFGAGAGNHKPLSMAVDGAGKVIVAGLMTNSLNFGTAPATLLTSAGGTDAFVAKLDPAASPPFAPIWSTRIGGPGPDEGRGVAVDSLGDVTVVGLLNGTTTGAANLTAATPTASSAFLLKLDGATGLTQYPAPGGAVHGDALHTVNANKIAINRQGTGPAKDLVVFGGEFTGALDFGSPTTPLSAVNAELFLVFARLLP